MPRTERLPYTTGATLYALPIDQEAYDAGDAVVGDESAVDGIYAFAALADATEYVVRKQAGGSPAESDRAVAVFDAVSTSGDAEQETLEEVQTAVNGIAAKLAGASSIEVASRVAAGGEITAYVGDDFRVRSGTELEIPISDVGGTLHTKLTAIGVDDLYFSASRPGSAAGQITGTIAALTVSGSGASQQLLISVEIEECGASLRPADDYTYQIEQRQDHDSETDSFVEIEGTLVLKRRA